jgi:hypothetical protein
MPKTDTIPKPLFDQLAESFAKKGRSTVRPSSSAGLVRGVSANGFSGGDRISYERAQRAPMALSLSRKPWDCN